MNKTFVFKTGAYRKIQIGSVNRYPKFFSSPDVNKRIVNLRMSDDYPINTGDCKFLPCRYYSIPSSPFQRLAFYTSFQYHQDLSFVLPEVVGQSFCLVFRYGISDYDIAVGYPEIPVVFGEQRNGLPLLRSFNLILLDLAVDGFPGISLCGFIVSTFMAAFLRVQK